MNPIIDRSEALEEAHERWGNKATIDAFVDGAGWAVRTMAAKAQSQPAESEGPDYGPAWLGVASARVMAQPGIAARHLRDYAALLKAQAQAEPYAWAVSGLGRPFYGEFAEQDARAEARRCGGTSEAFPLYRHSAQPKRQPLTARMACACGDEYDPGTAGGKEIFITGRCPGCNTEAEAAAPQPAQPERKQLTVDLSMNTPTIFERLRALHAARTRHFTSPEGVQAWSIVATEDRLADLLAAADELENGSKPLDKPRLQELFFSAISGAMAWGAQGANHPPAGHWLQAAWDLGRETQSLVEKANEARKQAQIERHDAIAARDRARIDLGRGFREQVRQDAQAVIMEWASMPGHYSVAQAVGSLCKRLGVEL